MGTAARRKKEQKVATTQLTEAAYFRLKAAIAERVAVQQSARIQIGEATAKVAKALTDAGLVADGNYELDDKQFTARRLP